MLGIGGRRFDRNRARFQTGDQGHQVRLLAFWVALIFLAQSLEQQPSNGDADDRVWDQIAFEQSHGPRGYRGSCRNGPKHFVCAVHD